MATIRTRYSKRDKKGKKVKKGQLGKPTYYVEIRKKGYAPVRGTFAKYDDAAKFATDVESAMNNGKWKERTKTIAGESAVKNIITMTQLIEYYKDNIAPSNYGDRAYMYKCMYDWWIDKIGNIKIRNLSPSDISECKQLLMNEDIPKKGGKTAKRKISTINKYILCLSTVLNYARYNLLLIDTNPCSRMTISKKGNPRCRFLKDDEIVALKDACFKHSKMIYIFFLILLMTGARYNEVLTLQVKNINFENDVIYYVDTKNNKSRGVGVDTKLLNLLKEYLNDRDIKDGHIFLNKKKTKLFYARGVLNQIIKNCKIEDFRIHDIRHTTASYLAMNGANLLEIAEILGHTSTVVTERYSHLTQKHTNELIRRVTNKILKEI